MLVKPKACHGCNFNKLKDIVLHKKAPTTTTKTKPKESSKPKGIHLTPYDPSKSPVSSKDTAQTSKSSSSKTPLKKVKYKKPSKGKVSAETAKQIKAAVKGVKTKKLSSV